jgi:hypothetical protein
VAVTGEGVGEGDVGDSDDPPQAARMRPPTASVQVWLRPWETRRAVVMTVLHVVGSGSPIAYYVLFNADALDDRILNELSVV